jgi:WD40-like Beta Propeller Repeat
MQVPVKQRLQHVAPVILAVLGVAVTAPTPASAASGSIAFLRGGSIWIAGPNGSNPRQLTTSGTYKWVSAAKGSGAPMLGFTSTGANGINVYGELSAAGGSPQPIATNSQPVEPFADAYLDAAGDKLAYVYQFYDPSISAFRHAFAVANVDGSANMAKGGYAVQDTSFADPRGTTVVWSGLVQGAFSPQPDTCAQGQIGLGFETPASNGGPDTSQPTFVICPTGQDTTQPSVSPDGTKVAASVTASGGTGPHMIDVFPKAAGASGTPVTPATMDVGAPDWSPDGSAIAFQGPNNTIWTVPAAGGSPTQILTNAERPAWTPYAPARPTPTKKKAVTKKKCHFVTRRIRGHKHRVKVCKTVKAGHK